MNKRNARLAAAIGALTVLSGQVWAAGSQYLVYFGTYTGPKSKGIYVSQFDASTGKLGPASLAAEIVRPSWVTIHPNGKFLYSVSELGNDSSITGFSIDKATGKLTMLNSVPTGGAGACHLAVDKAGKTIFVANYNSGSVASFRLGADGKVGDRVSLVQHKGSSVDAARQKGPHAHAVVLSADNKFLVVPDLGTDQYMVYRVAADGGLSPADPPSAKVKPGLGPRHFAFHPSGKFAYGLNEMGSAVTAFNYDGKGVLNEIETKSNLPPDFKGEDNSAEIDIDNGGKFVYASNRGDDSITVYSIAPGKGSITTVEKVSTQGKIPRGFKIDPTGKYLIAGNQNSDNVVVFQRDAKTGKLTPTGQVVEVGAPVCVQYLPK